MQRILGQPAWFNPVESSALIRQAIAKSNAPLNSYNKEGYTGLMRMVIDGRGEMVKLFVEYGANLNLKAITNSIQRGDTALLLAISFGSKIGMPEIIHYLISKKADVSIPNALGEQPIHVLRNVDDYGERLKILKELMERGAKINAQTKQGNTMLHLTVEHRDKKWIGILRDNFGSQLNMAIKNKKGLSPLMLAKKRNYIGNDSVAYYLEEYQPILGEGYGGYRERNELGQTPLMVAIIRNSESFAQKMIQKGLSVNATDHLGKTALFYAVQSESPIKFVEMLLARKVNVNAVDKQGKTAFLLVPRMKNKGKRIEIARLLIKAGANVNAQDNTGNTVWHEAVQLGDSVFIHALKREFGGLTKNKSGKTARDIARDWEKQVEKKAGATKNEKQKAVNLSSSVGG